MTHVGTRHHANKKFCLFSRFDPILVCYFTVSGQWLCFINYINMIHVYIPCGNGISTIKYQHKLQTQIRLICKRLQQFNKVRQIKLGLIEQHYVV